MFLTVKDFERAIQAEQLAQIVKDNFLLLDEAQAEALREVGDYLRQRYVVENIFLPITEYAHGGIYKAGARISLAAPSYSPSTTYRSGEYVSANGTVYRCIMQGTGIPVADQDFWQVVGLQGSLWFANIDTMQAPHTPDWTQGDNRHPLMMKFVRDISLYNIHCRISPRLIPEHRLALYEQAVAHLKRLGKGDIDSDLPQREKPEGRAFRWGNSSNRLDNYY